MGEACVRYFHCHQSGQCPLHRIPFQESWPPHFPPFTSSSHLPLRPSKVQTHHGPPLAEHCYISVRKSGLTYRRLPSLHRKRFLPKQITIFGVCAVSRITIAHFVRLWGKSGVRHCPADPPPYDVIPPRTQRRHTPSTLRGPLRASRVAMVIFRFFSICSYHPGHRAFRGMAGNGMLVEWPRVEHFLFEQCGVRE